MPIGKQHSRMVGRISDVLDEFHNETAPLLEEIQDEFGVSLDIEGALEVLTSSIQENRSVVLGVVGQIKAGKSSLLNALLFDGEESLATDVTPATARLTTVKYDPEKNCMNVQFYSENEWKEILKKAESETGVKRPFTQTVKDAERKLDDELSTLLGRVEHPGWVDSFDYVHKDGKYTDIVKMTEMYSPNPQLEHIEVVDTPGLNDIVQSRVEETYRQLDRTDAVLLLTSHGRILDANDLRLAMTQIREVGVGKVLLVIPQLDTYNHKQRAEQKTIIRDLSKRAEKFAESEGYGPGGKKIAVSWFKEDNTVQVSALAYSIARKKQTGRKLSKDEKFYFDKMIEDDEIPTDDMEKLILWSGVPDLERMIDEMIVQNKTALVMGRPLRKLSNVLNSAGSEVQRRSSEAKINLGELRKNTEELRKRLHRQRESMNKLAARVDSIRTKCSEYIYTNVKRNIDSSSYLSLSGPDPEGATFANIGNIEDRVALELRMETQDLIRGYADMLYQHTLDIKSMLQDQMHLLLDCLEDADNTHIESFLREMLSHFDAVIKLADEPAPLPDVEFERNIFQKIFSSVSSNQVKRAISDAITNLKNQLKNTVFPKMKDDAEVTWSSMTSALNAKTASIQVDLQKECEAVEDKHKQGSEALQKLESEYVRKEDLYRQLDVEIERVTASLSSILGEIEGTA